MLCNILRKLNTVKLRNVSITLIRFEQTKSEVSAVVEKSQIQLLDTRHLPNDDFINVTFEKKSVLDKCEEDISHVAPYLQPSFNFAAYVNKSETLQELLKLGVNLYKIEKKGTMTEYILGLDFERDIKNHVIFLHELGIDMKQIGNIITKTPLIFKENLEDMQVRINYLKSKKFNDEMILKILNKNPYWLMFSTQRIDRKLGFFQKEFSLNGNEVRQLTTKQPRIITYGIAHIKRNTFSIREEMGFTSEEVKQILLNKPKVFMQDNNKILNAFNYIHNTMKISLEVIAKFPEVLTCREFRIRQRHLFLEALGKNQYEPKLPNYLSILSIVAGSDSEFSTEVAKSSIQAYNMFLKSL